MPFTTILVSSTWKLFSHFGDFKSDMTLIQQQEEQQLIEEELEATRSVIRVLQKELDVIQRQLKTR